MTIITKNSISSSVNVCNMFVGMVEYHNYVLYINILCYVTAR